MGGLPPRKTGWLHPYGSTKCWAEKDTELRLACIKDERIIGGYCLLDVIHLKDESVMDIFCGYPEYYQ